MQYAAQDSIAWEQLDFRWKALLIDDFDASRLNSDARKAVLAILTMKFGCVVITCGDALLMHKTSDAKRYGGRVD